ncbi:MAG: phosphatidylinositol mannoside acyltransferase [Acidimicrobiales bacterium]
MPDRASGRYRYGAALARALPKRVADLAAAGVGIGAGSLAGERRIIVERHLARAYGELSGPALRHATRQVFLAKARYLVDGARLPTQSASQIDAHFVYDGYEHIDDALASGVGPILALPHVGSWEFAGAWLAKVVGHRVTAVVEALDDRETFSWMAGQRAAMGIDVVPLGPGAAAPLIRALKERSIVCLLCDRDIVGDGVEVTFFGEKTTLPAGPATLALRTGAALLPTAVYQRGSMNHGVVRPPIPVQREGRLRADVTRITQLLADELEIMIRAAPEQWHIMVPNWPSDLAALAAARAGG